MKISEYKNRMFYVAFFLLLAKICYSTSEIFKIPSIISKLITLIIGLLFITKIFLEEYTNKEKIIIITTGVMSLYTSYVTKDYNVFLTFLLIVSLKNVELKRVLKIILYFYSIMLLVHIVLYVLMLVFNNSSIRIYNTSSGQIRHSLALGHPNYASLIMCITYMSYIYLNYDKKSLVLEYIIGLILIVIINFTTKSRTTMISIPIFMLLIYISRMKKEMCTKIVKILSKYIFIVLSISIIIFLSVNSNYTKFEQKLDQVVSGRIWNMKKGFRNKGVSIFGQYINREDDKIILDNVYAKTIINYGIVYLIILAYLFYNNANKMKSKDGVIVIMFSVVGMTEYLIMNTCMSIPLIVLGDCIFNRNDGGEQSEISNCDNTSI